MGRRDVEQVKLASQLLHFVAVLRMTNTTFAAVPFAWSIPTRSNKVIDMTTGEHVTQIAVINRAVQIMCQQRPLLALENCEEVLSKLIWIASTSVDDNKTIEHNAINAVYHKDVQGLLPPWE